MVGGFMENLIEYIKPELLIVAVVLYGFGIFLKKTKLKDNFIPIVLGGSGIVIAITYCSILEGFGWVSIYTGFIQGLLCAASSNYVNQVIKQMRELGDKKATLAEGIVELVDEDEEEK